MRGTDVGREQDALPDSHEPLAILLHNSRCQE